MSKVHTVSVWDAPRHVREQFNVILKRARRKYGDHPDTCWLWEYKLNAQGYGEWKWYDHRDKKQRGSGAHRISLELVLGRALAGGSVAGHVCPKPPDGVHPDRRCFRPDHLAECTQSQNMLDWAELRRQLIGDLITIVNESQAIGPPFELDDDGLSEL